MERNKNQQKPKQNIIDLKSVIKRREWVYIYKKRIINDCTISICFLSLNRIRFLQHCSLCTFIEFQEKWKIWQQPPIIYLLLLFSFFFCFWFFFPFFTPPGAGSCLHCNYEFYQSVSVASNCPSAVSVKCLAPLMCTDIVVWGDNPWRCSGCQSMDGLEIGIHSIN